MLQNAGSVYYKMWRVCYNIWCVYMLQDAEASRLQYGAVILLLDVARKIQDVTLAR